MNKCFWVFALLAAFAMHAASQTPSPSPTSANPPVKLSDVLTKRLQDFDPKAPIVRTDREKAYAKLMEAQRDVWEASRLRNQPAVAAAVRMARTNLEQALEHDPGLSEAYTV